MTVAPYEGRLETREVAEVSNVESAPKRLLEGQRPFSLKDDRRGGQKAGLHRTVPLNRDFSRAVLGSRGGTA